MCNTLSAWYWLFHCYCLEILLLECSSKSYKLVLVGGTIFSFVFWSRTPSIFKILLENTNALVITKPGGLGQQFWSCLAFRQGRHEDSTELQKGTSAHSVLITKWDFIWNVISSCQQSRCSLLRGCMTHRGRPQVSVLLYTWISSKRIFLDTRCALLPLGLFKQLTGVPKYGWWKSALKVF